MAARTDFILAVKKLDNPDSGLEDLGDDLINECITDACREYTEYRPRGYRIATITVAVDDTEILLPADCFDLEDDTAFLLAYGITRSQYRVPGSYPARLGMTTINPIDLLSNTTDPPTLTSQGDPPAIPRSTNSAGRISILLADAATETRSHEIRYQAYHTITDSPEVNTIEDADRRKVRQLVLGYMADARSKIAVDPAEVAKWERKAESYFKIRDQFIGACGAIG